MNGKTPKKPIIGLREQGLDLHTKIILYYEL